MRKNRLRTANMLLRKKGFTLIEIIIALAILGAGLISVMAYLPVALDASKRASDLTKATLIARGLFEKIRSASYEDITGADTFDTGVFSPEPDYPGFETVVDVSPSGVSQTKDVTIKVRWKSRAKFIEEEFKTTIVKYNPT